MKTSYVVRLMYTNTSGYPAHTEQEIQASCGTEAFYMAEALRRKTSAEHFNVHEGHLEIKNDTTQDDTQASSKTRRHPGPTGRR
jgi:hypothetical protein